MKVKGKNKKDDSSQSNGNPNPQNGSTASKSKKRKKQKFKDVMISTKPLGTIAPFSHKADWDESQFALLSQPKVQKAQKHLWLIRHGERYDDHSSLSMLATS